MKRIFTLLLLISFFANIHAQEKEYTEEDQKIERTNVLLLNGLFNSSKIGFGIRYKSLYTVKNSLQIGWGVGLESFSSGVERNFIPLSIDVVGDVFDVGPTPFYMISAGYGIPLKEDPNFATSSRGGFMLDVSLGYRVKKDKTHSFVAMGYRVQNASYLGTDQFGNTDKEVVYKRWSLSLGTFF